jgi:hypothetical protein
VVRQGIIDYTDEEECSADWADFKEGAGLFDNLPNLPNLRMINLEFVFSF